MFSPRLMLALVGLPLFLVAAGCSTDTSGLGEVDSGVPRGTGGAASGGRSGTGGRGTGGSAPGGSGGAATGGAATGGAATGGAATGGAASGGTGSGGMGTGGASSGGASSGGRFGGNGGRFGGGSGGAGDPRPECMTNGDCHLQNDCCTCAAMPDGATAPSCPLLCIQSKCNQLNLPQGEVACVAGRCVAGFNCDSSRVSCEVATPSCPVGQVPGVNPSGTCYSGGCVPVTQCRRVTSCAVCAPEQACVFQVTAPGNRLHCVTIPPVCQGGATCGCLGSSTCVSPATTCTNLSGLRGVACSCPNC